MFPIICRIGPFTIFSYGLMLALAFAVSTTLIYRRALAQGNNPEVFFNLAFIVFIAGIIGARILYVAENLSYYKSNLVEVFFLQHGGLSWFGGLASGSLCGIFYLKRRSLSVYETLDLVAPYVALGQALGRIGCLLNGCCYGRETGHGLYFSVHDAMLVPIQLYSSLALLAIFVALRLLQERSHRRGDIFFAYLLLYSLKRFIVEFWRQDNPAVIAGLTLFQLLSAALFIAALIKISAARLSRR